MTTVYRIRDWAAHFEVAQTRKIKGDLSWVAIPCKHDGKSFRRLMRHKHGPQMYSAWVLILQVAAKCPERGVLADEDGPLSCEDLELKTGLPSAIFDEALKFLSSKEIGWMEADGDPIESTVLVASSTAVDWSGSTADDAPDTGHNRTEQDSTLQDIPANAGCDEPPAADSPPDPVVLEFPTNRRGEAYKLRASKLAEYQQTYEYLDVLAVLRGCRQWCIDKPSRRKTLTGFPGFLTGWLNRQQNSGGARGHPQQGRAEGYEAIQQFIDAHADDPP
jgi:hypothetical protein